MAKEVAILKRAQIDKATSHMLVAVGIASVILGCAAVLSVYFVKWIIFNATVIGEKTAIVDDFTTIQKNASTLESSISDLSYNENLEVVARARDNSCSGYGEEEIDVTESIGLARICSALRVIPDALPSIQNNEAVYASLNKLFLTAGVEPESISPGNSNNMGVDVTTGLGAIAVSLLVEESSSVTRAVLDTIERSIRNYDITTATIAWRSTEEGGAVDAIELRGTANAYYSSTVAAELKPKTICADKENTKCTGVKKK